MPSVPRVDRLKPIYTAAKALNFGWRFSDFLKIPAYNGISRYTNQLHRITVRFCKQSESSVGVRNFIENQIVEIGKLFYLKQTILGLFSYRSYDCDSSRGSKLIVFFCYTCDPSSYLPSNGKTIFN